jgi:surfactin synthase thioesterase subunit
MPTPLALHRPLATARARIFAFPHAGGGASAFTRLRAALAAHDVELCPLQPAGRENRWGDAPSESVEAMALEFADAIGGLPSLPFALLGHSFGGLVAYATASVLQARGHVASHFIASGSAAPQTEREAIDHLDKAAFRQKMLGLGGIPDLILQDEDLYAMFEAGIRHDMRLGSAAAARSSGFVLSCPVTVYCGSEDRAASPASAGAWQKVASRPIGLRVFEGGHFFLYADPERTAAGLMEDLNLPPRVSISSSLAI